jgi:hypothetical protein
VAGVVGNAGISQTKEGVYPMNVLPFSRRGENPVEIEERNEEPKPRSIILPMYLWDIVGKDAERCRRSMNKHLEAILVMYYGIESSVNINEEALKSEERVMPKPELKKTA